MGSRPPWHTPLATIAVLIAIACGYAGLVAVSAKLIGIGGVPFLPVALVYALLFVPANYKRVQGMMEVGADGRRRLIDLKNQYLVAVRQDPDLRDWPADTWRCLGAAALVLVRASLRGWFVLIVCFGVYRLMGQPIASDLQVLWLVLTGLEAIFIVYRSYQRGTLALIGMSPREMEAYFQKRLGGVQPWEV